MVNDSDTQPTAFGHYEIPSTIPTTTKRSTYFPILSHFTSKKILWKDQKIFLFWNIFGYILKTFTFETFGLYWIVWLEIQTIQYNFKKKQKSNLMTMNSNDWFYYFHKKILRTSNVLFSDPFCFSKNLSNRGISYLIFLCRKNWQSVIDVFWWSKSIHRKNYFQLVERHSTLKTWNFFFASGF